MGSPLSARIVPDEFGNSAVVCLRLVEQVCERGLRLRVLGGMLGPYSHCPGVVIG
ncbi:hypothetical protein ACSBQT_00415 [Brevibacterium sp. H602]|uniref:hypothetical protein n=1 Tax=unclassified Brevibacterium TaxID=2614124 RepID=UPI0039783A1B